MKKTEVLDKFMEKYGDKLTSYGRKLVGKTFAELPDEIDEENLDIDKNFQNVEFFLENDYY